jgi:hypothetical protein
MGFANKIPIRGRIEDSATATQIAVSPWRERRRYVLNKLTLVNETATACVVMFYDDDTNDSSNTAPQRGTGTTDPVFAINLAASVSVTLTPDQIPFTFFQGGMVAQTVNASLSGSTGIFVFGEMLED